MDHFELLMRRIVVRNIMERKMQSNPTLKGTARRIAEAIVELVEDADGPVTLYRLDQEIPGFAKQDPPSWSHMLFGDEKFIWSGMTKAGHIALGYVLR